MINVLCSLQVFYPGEKKPVFFVANRGHHAEIGGITPGGLWGALHLSQTGQLTAGPVSPAGSMPAHSKHLWEEGMCVKSFKLVQNGIFQEEGRLALC